MHLFDWMFIILALAALAAAVFVFTTIKPLGRQTYDLANIAEGETPKGHITLLPDVQIPCGTTGERMYFVAKRGARPNSGTLAGAGDKPLGIWYDSTDMAVPGGGIVSILTRGLVVKLLGCADGTRLVSLNSDVAQDDWLTTDANGYAKSLPAATPGIYWVFGRALQAGAAGDNIQFEPCEPRLAILNAPIYAGVIAATVASVNDIVPVANLLSTDIVVVTINTQAGAEVIKSAVPAAGQINVTLSAAATIGTTKYNVTVHRPITA